MKFKVLIITSILACLGFKEAHADYLDRCTFTNGQRLTQSINVIIPGNVDLRSVPIGSSMATSNIATAPDMAGICPYPTVRNAQVVYSVEGGELEEGFDNVYKTGLKGIGVRFSSITGRVMPFTIEFVNSSGRILPLNQNLRADFIRTSRDVMPGRARLGLQLVHTLNGWRAKQTSFTGNINFQSQSYFRGCAGVEKLNIPMGRVHMGSLGTLPPKPFNLDVLCEGLPAGARLPVKVYFEGNSDGPGRLNLEPGGAQGVEIALTNDRGVNLPFSQGSALDMTWTRSEPNGELYRLPIVAEYARKGTQKTEAGKANGTLNYILEYN